MSTVPFITAAEVEHLLSWKEVSDAIFIGHQSEQATIDDILIHHGRDSLLVRAAWIRGLGMGSKTATIFPSNMEMTPPVPNVQAIYILLNDKTGAPVALMDGDMLTKWKTAADSILGARLLARPDSKNLLVIGAGTVARSLIEAYPEQFPGLEKVLVWNRTHNRAQTLASRMHGDRLTVQAIEDLAAGVAVADIVATATLSTEPVLKGEWVRPGTHVDLIGAYRPDMREADDVLIKKAKIFVDSRETAIHDIGELAIPIREGIITVGDIRGDLYDLCNGATGRTSEQDITVYKNGGGGHLDLMTANVIFAAYQASGHQHPEY